MEVKKAKNKNRVKMTNGFFLPFSAKLLVTRGSNLAQDPFSLGSTTFL